MKIRATAISAAVFVCALLGVAVVAPARAVPGAMALVASEVSQTTVSIGWQGADTSSPVIVGWQDESSPKGSSTWEGRYPAATTSLTLTGLTPSHRYWIYVTLDGAGYEPVSTTVTTKAAPSAPIQATRSGCVAKTLASKTAASSARLNARQMRVGGYVSYWTSAGWQPAPVTDYRLALQRKVGSAWSSVTTIAPGSRPALVTVPRGTYRLAFTGICTQPVAPSVSTTFTK